MDAIVDVFGQLREAAGASWLIAVAVTFVTMICESAGPIVEPGEEKPKPGALRVASLVASLFTPILLFVHAYWAIAVMDAGGAPDSFMAVVLMAFRSAVLIGVYVMMLALILLPGVFASLLRKASPPLARATYAAAPVLSIAVFVFVAYVTQRNVAAAVDLILSRLG